MTENMERITLSPYATLSQCVDITDRRVYPEKRDPIRARFARDRDRIIHAKSFMLMPHKTQVFPVLPGIKPILTTRPFHVLRVDQLAKTIGRALGLNEDLIEAIALPHDIGHMPFGHAGERAIQVATKHDIPRIGKPFRHEEWGLRIVDALETIEGRAIPGLNLTFEVRDGIARHCGEELDRILVPSREYDLNITALPTTLEGCLVKIIDVVGYAPQDLNDLMYAGYTHWDKVPASIKNVLGGSIRKMYDTLVKDIIENSKGKNMICMSPRCFKALKQLVDFNMKIFINDLGKMEDKITKKIVKAYERYKKEGLDPMTIIDTFVRMTDLQLYENIMFNVPHGEWFYDGLKDK
jgi:dGTPase